MATTKIILDRQAQGKIFDFGTASASQQALVTLYNGTAAASNVVLDLKGALQLNSGLGGVLKATAGLVTGSATTQDLTEHASNLYYTSARVTAHSINQFTEPDGDVSLGGFKIFSLAEPTDAGDAATKQYVDSVSAGLDVKQSVRAATTATGTLASDFENGDAIDGVTLATNDRILIKDQSTGSQNGIYKVNASGAPTRTTDADNASEINGGMFVFVEEGTANSDSGWVMTNDGAITLNTTALTFSQFSGAGQIVAGSALTKSGNTLDVAVDNSSIEINSDALRVKAAGITNAMLAGSIDLTAKVTGVLPEANGGTGESTYTDGQILIGNSSGNGLTKASLTAGANVTITPGNGSITIAAATGGTSYDHATAVSGTQDSSNKVFTIANAVSTGSEKVWLNGQLLTPGSSNDYVISGTTVTFQAAIDPPAATDTIRAYGDY